MLGVALLCVGQSNTPSGDSFFLVCQTSSCANDDDGDDDNDDDDDDDTHAVLRVQVGATGTVKLEWWSELAGAVVEC